MSGQQHGSPKPNFFHWLLGIKGSVPKNTAHREKIGSFGVSTGEITLSFGGAETETVVEFDPQASVQIQQPPVAGQLPPPASAPPPKGKKKP